MAKKVKEYKVKTLFNGKVIAKIGKFIAVPEKGYKQYHIIARFGDKTMFIKRWLDAVAFRRFPDKWGRGTYTLGYFEWKPDSLVGS